MSQSHSQSTTPLIFVPGIKGSILCNAKGRVQWVTLLQALGIKTPELALPLEWPQTRDGLGPLTVMGGTFVYGPWLKLARRVRTVIGYAYDWRRDPNEAAQGLIALLHQIREKSPTGKVDIAGHRLGGLIAWEALNGVQNRCDWIDRVLLAGVPFRGGISFLPDLHEGVSTGLNSKIMGPDVLFTYSSLYSLFPLRSGKGGMKAGNSAGIIVDSKGTPLPIDFFSAEDWRRYRMGGFRTNLPESEATKKERFLRGALAAARKFLEVATTGDGSPYPETFLIRSRGIPTLARARINERGELDFRSLPLSPGDGRILYGDDEPPFGAVPFRAIETEAHHSKLLNDPRLIDLLEEKKL